MHYLLYCEYYAAAALLRWFCLLDPMIWAGSRLADFALLLLNCCLVAGVAGKDGTPCNSRIRHLPGWILIAVKAGVSLHRVDSCAYGFELRKSFGILAVYMALTILPSPAQASMCMCL